MQIQPGSRILLVGAGGKTGIAYGKLLLMHNYTVLAYDKNSAFTTTVFGYAAGKVQKVAEEDFVSGKILEQCDYVTLSPGVWLGQTIFKMAKAQQKEIFSELEYTSQFLRNKIIAITGTDGKSTVTALTAHLLNSAGFEAIACGNYGLPYSQLLLQNVAENKILVTELSSYQLELSRNFAPQVSVYLNLAPDHLDRYESLESYGLAKWNMIQNQGAGNTLVVNHQLMPGVTPLWKSKHPLNARKGLAVYEVFESELRSTHFRIEAGMLYDIQGQKVHALTDFHLTGNHNLSNLLFALEAARASTQASTADLLKKLGEFMGLPHRYEKLKTNLPHTFINDSKATTTQACITAIRNTPGPVLIFLGGKGKGETYGGIAEALSRAQAFLYGAEAQKMAADLSSAGFQKFTVYDTLGNAFAAATEFSEKSAGEKYTFLLSPAATSWDQYGSFEERGDHFKKLVSEYSKQRE